MRCLFRMRMGNNSQYMMLDNFAFYDRIEAKYTSNLQRALFVPRFEFLFRLVSLLVKQGITVIFRVMNFLV